MKTQLSNALELAQTKAKYDSYVKQILSNKVILAWILKYTTEEFADCDIEAIISLIEGEPEISAIPIYPGKANQKPEKLSGMSTNDKTPYEGEITYDIRFHVYSPTQERIKLIVNIEAQKKFKPGYDIVTRGVFYAARMLSSQLDVEFTTNNYDNIKKVYSIWICLDTNKNARNTITKYKLSPCQVYGNFKEKVRYDLLEVILVCLGKNNDKQNSQLLNLLNTLLTEQLTPLEKEKILATDFNIQPNIKLKEEINSMCNLSDLIEERATEQGIKIFVETLKETGQSNEFIINALVNKFSLSETDAKKYVCNCQKSI